MWLVTKLKAIISPEKPKRKNLNLAEVRAEIRERQQAALTEKREKAKQDVGKILDWIRRGDYTAYGYEPNKVTVWHNIKGEIDEINAMLKPHGVQVKRAGHAWDGDGPTWLIITLEDDDELDILSPPSGEEEEQEL